MASIHYTEIYKEKTNGGELLLLAALVYPSDVFSFGGLTRVCVCVYTRETQENNTTDTQKGGRREKLVKRNWYQKKKETFFFLLFLETYTHDGCSDGGLSFLHLFVHGRRVVEL
jgi:hypothetical protein